jgi:predicted amidophosphoribosyltransferase
MSLHRALASAIAPPLCAACGRHSGPGEIICRVCQIRLERAAPLGGAGPPGADRAWSSSPYEGPARDLVAALKFRGLLPVAALIAERIARLAPPELLSGAIVPVPTARRRTLVRGFDPAAEIALALVERSGLPLSACLVRRGGGRQLGRRRGERLARAPAIHPRAPVPASAVLLDDVLTTGATISAAAGALRAAGAVRVVAITFARRL